MSLNSAKVYLLISLKIRNILSNFFLITFEYLQHNFNNPLIYNTLNLFDHSTVREEELVATAQEIRF